MLKRRKLIKILESNGWYLLRHGANHDIYTNDTKVEPIERHTEIPEMLARAILKRNNISDQNIK